MLIESISQNLTNTKQGQPAHFSNMDLNYGYSQLQLQKDTAKHCNLKMFCGETTSTHRFKAGFYGLTDIPAKFQNAMDYTLLVLRNTYCFLDDIIIVSTGSESDHMNYIIKCLEKFYKKNLLISFQKRNFAKTKINWLVYKFTQRCISPLK